jgi:hypothetical protein
MKAANALRKQPVIAFPAIHETPAIEKLVAAT